jgi:PAS domain S-box-containing protein
MAARRRDAAEKAAIVLEGLQGKPVPAICDEHEISATEYQRWHEQFLSNISRPFQIVAEPAKVDVAQVFAARGRPGEEPLEMRVAQELIDALPVPVFFKARDGRYLGVNRAWEQFFGVPRDDFLGRQVVDLYPQDPVVAETHRLMDEALWREPGSQSYEIRLTLRDGRARDTLYCKATFSDGEGRVTGLIGTIIDITERKQGEQRHAIEHAIMRTLAEADAIEAAIPRMIAGLCETLDWGCGARWIMDGEALACRETWCENVPATAAFVAAMRGMRLVPKNAGLIRRVLATGLPVCIPAIADETSFTRGRLAVKAGFVSAFALPVRVGDRTIGALEFFSRQRIELDAWMRETALALGSQIGEFMARKQAEQELRASEARFRSLTELSSDWYWEQDEFYRFTAFSKGILERAGVAQEAFLGKTRWDGKVIDMSPADWAAHKALLDARKPFYDLEYGRIDADGKMRYLSTSGQPVFDASGRFAGYRGVGRDITARKLAEAALRAAHDDLERKAKELQRSNAELEQFAYVASHDLQEPLRMIGSYTQLLERRYASRLDSDALEFMHFIVDGATRMKQLIEDLLAYSRVGTRGKALQRVSMKAVYDRAVLNLRGAIEQSGVIVASDVLPEVWGDDVQLAQLLQNLIANALKFRREAPPRIHLGVSENEREWTFCMSDNGIGIEPAYFERIFMVFQRLHTRDEYPGTGIGLAICKKVVDRHGGRIWVESEPGAGSRFSFTLPKEPLAA